MQFQPNLGLHHSVFGGQDPSILKSDTLEKPFQTISDSEIIAALTLAAATHFGVSFHEKAPTVSEWNAIQKHINLPP